MNIKNELLLEAEKGNADAQYKVAEAYAEGVYNEPKDSIEADKLYQEAFKWYKMAAEKGHVEAQCEVGHFYSRDFYHGIKGNREEALKWYQEAAENGNIEAQLRLYRIFNNLEKNKAIKWLRMAAEQECVWAIRELGSYYENLQDIEEANKWYQKASTIVSSYITHVEISDIEVEEEDMDWDGYSICVTAWVEIKFNKLIGETEKNLITCKLQVFKEIEEEYDSWMRHIDIECEAESIMEKRISELSQQTFSIYDFDGLDSLDFFETFYEENPVNGKELSVDKVRSDLEYIFSDIDWIDGEFECTKLFAKNEPSGELENYAY